MTEASPPTRVQTMTKTNHQSSGRLCDYCGQATALVYCRADSAKLCFYCDRDVHSTNQLFTKHTRFLLCNSCGDASATIFCETERSVLCHNCDWETHSGGQVHSRRPVEGFTGCPSVGEIKAFLGLEGTNFPVSLGDCKCEDEFSDLFVWETPAFVSLDDLMFSAEKFDALPTMDVPPPPKNRNATCGKHKEEILRQLRSLAKLECNINFENVDSEAGDDFKFLDIERKSELGSPYDTCDHHADPVPVFDPAGVAPYCYDDEGLLKDQNYYPSPFSTDHCEANPTNVDKEPDSGGLSGATGCDGLPEHSMNSNPLPFLPRVPHHDLNTQDRESAICRYKQKRKTRRYDRQVRYESRKVRAESRTRVRGRFAKINHHP